MHKKLLNALAGGQVDKDLGIYDQNGMPGFQYSFALTTNQQPFDAVTAMKFAMEHQNPLATAAVTGVTNAYPSTSFSLLSVDHPSLLLWSLKPAEEGIQKGIIARLWNLGNKAVKPTLKMAVPIKSAWQTSHIETNENKFEFKGNNMKLDFEKHQINTYRIITR